jgi:hypothetical protein
MVLVAQGGVGGAFTNLLQQILSAIPVILEFLLIVLIGYIVARLVRAAVARLLQGVGLDRTLHENQYGQYAERLSPGASPSQLIGTIAFFFVLLGAISIAISSTGNPGLTSFLEGIYAYLPKVVAAIIIFVVAGAIATAVGALVQRTMGDTSTGQIVQTVVPVLVMGIAVFMILDQLEIAPDIVRTAFQALMFGTALGLALAFGLGGREVASKMVSEAFQKGQEKSGAVRRDLETGMERGQQDAERAKQRAQQEHAARSQQGGDAAAAQPVGTPPAGDLQPQSPPPPPASPPPGETRRY